MKQRLMSVTISKPILKIGAALVGVFAVSAGVAGYKIGALRGYKQAAHEANSLLRCIAKQTAARADEGLGGDEALARTALEFIRGNMEGLDAGLSKKYPMHKVWDEKLKGNMEPLKVVRDLGEAS